MERLLSVKAAGFAGGGGVVVLGAGAAEVVGAGVAVVVVAGAAVVAAVFSVLLQAVSPKLKTRTKMRTRLEITNVIRFIDAHSLIFLNSPR
ncbi:MAG: hypothetical protein A2Y90_04470 [Chloroflexi bacterium RBG_13_52_12]|nr:MAG: hypothetical protein A2Y90_04470 [Chloroflexi bacterium RBG_13_52_12]